MKQIFTTGLFLSCGVCKPSRYGAIKYKHFCSDQIPHQTWFRLIHTREKKKKKKKTIKSMFKQSRFKTFIGGETEIKYDWKITKCGGMQHAVGSFINTQTLTISHHESYHSSCSMHISDINLETNA